MNRMNVHTKDLFVFKNDKVILLTAALGDTFLSDHSRTILTTHKSRIVEWTS